MLQHLRKETFTCEYTGLPVLTPDVRMWPALPSDSGRLRPGYSYGHPLQTTVRVCHQCGGNIMKMDVWRAFGGRCMVSGQPESAVLLSIDVNRMAQDGRYDWSDTILMALRINKGKTTRGDSPFASRQALT